MASTTVSMAPVGLRLWLTHLLLLCSLPLAFSRVLAAPKLQSAGPSPTVKIASGVLIGKQTSIPNRPDISDVGNVYLGVPFAKSPPERFSPPVAAPAWQSPLVAQSLKPACIQEFPGPKAVQDVVKQYFNNPTGEAPEESEDCLYLNVYTPSNATAESKRPVMFWLYGGNLMFGTGGLKFYDGTSLAVTQDVVVVTINYRTNIFGFSNSPEIPFGSQNAGYLDQRFALRWVHDNIAAFGGDPDRVLIFGESSGGESVRQLVANPPDPPMFHAAVMESAGSVLIGNGVSNYNKVLSNFKCQDIQCLRKVPATDIKEFIQANLLLFPPVENDGTNVKDTLANFKPGKKLPAILIGSNNNEIRIFVAIVQAVLGSSNPAGGLASIYDKVATNAAWGCTASRQGALLAGKGYPVWRYRYDASIPQSPLFSDLMAFHTAEIPAVFGTYPPFKQATPEAKKYAELSKFMQSVWAGFAARPDQGPGWPRIGGSKDGRELGALGGENATGLAIVQADDSPCGVVNGFANLVGIP